MTDKVNHPNHYKQGKYEAIDIINDVVQHYKGDVGYNIGNVLKYIIRAPHKHETPTEDLQKALKYLEFAVKLVTGEEQYNEMVQSKELVNELLALKSEHEALENEYTRVIDALSEANEREVKYRKALEFYGNFELYRKLNIMTASTIDADKGETARKALEENK